MGVLINYLCNKIKWDQLVSQMARRGLQTKKDERSESKLVLACG